jgi:hypothetical protein
MYERLGYCNVPFTLHYADGRPVELDDIVEDRDGSTWRITGGQPPHKMGSTGRVYCRPVESEGFFDAAYFPGVFGMEWRKVE